MRVVRETFIIEEDINEEDLRQLCKEYEDKFGTKSLCFCSTRKLASLVINPSKGYRLSTDNPEDFVPCLFRFDFVDVIELRDIEDNKLFITGLLKYL